MVGKATVQLTTWISIVVWTLMIASVAAQQPTELACASFELERHLDRIAFIDHGDEGVSVGDQRVLRFDLTTQDGEAIGHQQVLATVVHGSLEGEHEMMIDGTAVFNAGLIRVSTIGPLRDPADTSTASADTLDWNVDGGTGVFIGAYGTMTTVPRGDGSYHVVFDISCLDLD
ncbi:MAG: hypothetical protein AAF414_21655 [Pseudomonadota bacterium]